MSTINHKFDFMSVKTSNKDGHKYLGKNGTQAYRVSIKVGEDWYANMIWDEDLLPKKGASYTIELSENDGFKNWAYKLLTKKEQVLEQVKAAAVNSPIEPPFPVSEVYSETPPKNLVGRGASFNLAFQYCLENKITDKQGTFPGGTIEFTKESFEDFIKRVTETAEKILPYQDKFVNQ